MLRKVERLSNNSMHPAPHRRGPRRQPLGRPTARSLHRKRAGGGVPASGVPLNIKREGLQGITREVVPRLGSTEEPFVKLCPAKIVIEFCRK
jgi:hypothetical protein